MTTRHEATRQPDTCPGCGSKGVARIAYGIVEESPEFQSHAERHDVIIPSDELTEDDPTWVCKACGARIYKVPHEDFEFSDPDEAE